MRAASSVSVLAIGLALAGCAQRGSADAKICSPFPNTAAATAADPVAATAAGQGGDAAAFDDCLHRWGYKLASSDDGADLVGQAVVAVCAPVLTRWNSASLGQPQNGPDVAISLVTGKSQSAPSDRYEMAQAKALFYVVQARAGNCAAP